MTGTQKIIKYLAIAFAFCLIAGIVTGGISLFTFVSDLTGESDSEIKNKDFSVGENTKNLKINLTNTDIVIKEGDKLSVETTKDNVVVKEKLGSFSIVEKKTSAKLKEDGQVVLTIPKGYVFDKVDINTGKGKLVADVLRSEKIYLDFGAGEVIIEKLISEEKANINGGAGRITINNGKFYGADIDVTAGSLDVTAEFLGSGNIDCGIGNVNINLKGSEDDYRISVDKGIGGATIKGEAVAAETTYGTGGNMLDVEGGLGEIKIDFVK